MDEELRDLLGEAIKEGIENLSALAPGSKEQEIAVDNVAKLYRLKIEETKNEQDFSERFYRREMEDKHHQMDGALKEKQVDGEAEARERDMELKEKQLKDQVIERYFRYGAICLELIVPIIAYSAWYHKGLKFEENGTVRTPMLKNLMSKMLPKSKN